MAEEPTYLPMSLATPEEQNPSVPAIIWGSVETVDDSPDAEAIAKLTQACMNLQQGNFRAALVQAADACNAIAEVHDINGGGWY